MDEEGAKWEEEEEHRDIYAFLEEGLSAQLKVGGEWERVGW